MREVGKSGILFEVIWLKFGDGLVMGERKRKQLRMTTGKQDEIIAADGSDDLKKVRKILCPHPLTVFI